MGTDGTYGDPASEKLTGTTGSTATYAPEAREGFTVADESVLSGTIAADGSLVLKVYYSRNKYTLTVDGVASEVYYGAAVSVAEPSKEHYTFAGWEPELPDTMPANDVKSFPSGQRTALTTPHMMQQSQRLRRRRPRLTMIRPTPQSPERLSMQLLQKKFPARSIPSRMLSMQPPRLLTTQSQLSIL